MFSLLVYIYIVILLMRIVQRNIEIIKLLAEL